MPSRTRTALYLVLTLLLVPAVAQANDASFHGDGATVFAIKENRVRMEKEAIRIRYDKKTQRWVADCRFRFVNTSQETVEVLMGFPDWYAHGEEPERDAKGKPVGDPWAMREFKVWVGGKRVTPEHKEIKEPAPGEYPHLQKEELGYHAAYTWPVKFRPGQKLEVRNTYRFGGTVTMGPPEACLWGAPDAEKAKAWWMHAADRAGGWRFSDAPCRNVRYIVTTGKTWGGPIGEADISIEIPPGTLPHLIQPIPAATEVTRKAVHWRFRDFVPTQEMTVVELTPYPAEDETRKKPLLDTPEQVKAWGDMAVANHYDPSWVDVLLAGYKRQKVEGYAEVVTALREVKARLRAARSP